MIKDYSKTVNTDNTDKTNTSALTEAIIIKCIAWALYAIVIMMFWNGTVTKFFPEIVRLTWHDSFFGVLSLEIIAGVFRH